jgi:hypothetical protein
MNAVQVAQLAELARRSKMPVIDYKDGRDTRHVFVTLPTHLAYYAISRTAAVTGYRVPR